MRPEVCKAFFCLSAFCFCFEVEGICCHPHCQLSKSTISTWQLPQNHIRPPGICTQRKQKEKTYSFIPNGSSRTWRMCRMRPPRFAVASCCMCKYSSRKICFVVMLSQCMFYLLNTCKYIESPLSTNVLNVGADLHYSTTLSGKEIVGSNVFSSLFS